MSADPEQQPAPAAVPADTNDTLGTHIGRLLTSWVTLIGGGLLALVVFALVASQGGSSGSGGLAAAAVVVAVIVIVVIVAYRRAADDFFTAYAQGRGLSRVKGHSSLPPVTPLLRKGDERYADERFNGVLPGGLNGSLCLYTYEEVTHDSDGNRETTYVHYTIAMTDLPDAAGLLAELYCQRRVGFRFMDSMEDVFRTRQRVEQESDAVDKKYEIFIGRNDAMNTALQVLSPTFLVWLEAHSPEHFAFELCAGSLVCNVKGHKHSADELDLLCTSTAAVARRIQEESTETKGQAAQPPASPGA